MWFLYTHVWLCGYGSYLITTMLTHVIDSKDLWRVQYRDAATGKYVPSNIYFVMHYLSYYHG